MKLQIQIVAACSLALASLSAQSPYRGFVVRNEVNGSEIRQIRQDFGGNVIKWEFFMDDRPRVQAQLNHLRDVVLPECLRHGVGVILDMHQPAGGVRGTGNARRHPCLIDPSHRSYTRWIEDWLAISQIARGHSAVVGYDLLAEPLATVGEWRARALDVIGALRRAGDPTRVIVEMPFGNPEHFDAFGPITRPRFGSVAYGFHYYSPHSYTHQARGIYGPQSRNQALWPAAIDLTLSEAVEFKRRNHVEMFCLGFSAHANAQNSLAYLSDCIDRFERAGISWTYHTFTFYPGDQWHMDEYREDLLKQRM
ncbi:MAG: cellulase family glycosylhydrolase [Planctomycetes bacterium]|nr:cellulase family glycosylhydrolase [Planctomycetota bacterium]